MAHAFTLATDMIYDMFARNLSEYTCIEVVFFPSLSLSLSLSSVDGKCRVSNVKTWELQFVWYRLSLLAGKRLLLLLLSNLRFSKIFFCLRRRLNLLSNGMGGMYVT